MPVRVECDVQPSRRHALYTAVPIAAGMLLLPVLNLPLWTLLLWGGALYACWHHGQSQFKPDHLSCDGNQIVLWIGDDVIRMTWTGEGRLSHAFIQWQLVDGQAQRLVLRIWKDSVTEPSWRALNMGFRVNQPGVRANASVTAL